MNFLDWIKKLLTNNKKNARIITKTLVKTYGTTDQLEIGLIDDENKPLKDKILTININGRDYERKTDSDGIVRLNINLNIGIYTVLISFGDDDTYNSTNAFTEVIVKSNTHMEGTDVNKTVSQEGVYQCAVYDKDNQRLKGVPVVLSVNGVNYTRQTDSSTGLAQLNIRLNQGKYTLNATFEGNELYNQSKTSNIINVTSDPVKSTSNITNNTVSSKLYNYITVRGAGKLGQKTSYSCGPHSLMQAIYRLTGIELYETKLMQVCGTTTSGTSHQGLATGLAWFNKEYGYNLKMRWYNKSELSWEQIQKLMDENAVFFHLLYRNKWGHYEVAKNTDLLVLNSLGDACNNGYCGYLESRGRSVQQGYISGISQKSVCVISK